MTVLPSDEELVARLHARDEAAFALLLDAWSGGLHRVARSFVSTDASADEVVQETWLAVIAHLGSFEGRASLKTWVFRILANTAKRRARREGRTVAWPDTEDADGPTVDPARFQGAGEEDPRHWRSFPAPWPTPEEAALGSEVAAAVRAAIAELTPRQRLVITLRDVQGCSAEEVRAVLEISAANQRVLLHRARAHVRAALESYYDSQVGTEETHS